MENFNANNFIKSFKGGYNAIANHQGDQAAKVQVGDAIKATGFNPDVVLAYICDKMGNPSIKLSNEEWKDIIKRAIKNGDFVGKCLEVCAAVEKGSKKVSYEDHINGMIEYVADKELAVEFNHEAFSTNETETQWAIASMFYSDKFKSVLLDNCIAWKEGGVITINLLEDTPLNIESQAKGGKK